MKIRFANTRPRPDYVLCQNTNTFSYPNTTLTRLLKNRQQFNLQSTIYSFINPILCSSKIVAIFWGLFSKLLYEWSNYMNEYCSNKSKSIHSRYGLFWLRQYCKIFTLCCFGMEHSLCKMFQWVWLI